MERKPSYNYHNYKTCNNLKIFLFVLAFIYIVLTFKKLSYFFPLGHKDISYLILAYMSSQFHLQVLSDVSSPFQVKLLKTFVNSNYDLFLPSYLLLNPRLCRLSPLHFSNMALSEFTSPYSFLHLSS